MLASNSTNNNLTAIFLVPVHYDAMACVNDAAAPACRVKINLERNKRKNFLIKVKGGILF